VDLSKRSTEHEVMDDPDTSVADYKRCLHDLATVNRITFTHGPTLRWLGKATRGLPKGSHLSVLDVGCGEGDLLRAIEKWANKKGFVALLEGIDLNPRSATTAIAATPPNSSITYLTGNVFDFEPVPVPDFIVSSQFTHHLADDEIPRFLEWQERHAGRGWFIADLHRRLIPYYGFRVLCVLAGWHRIVRLDGTISIARSFRVADWIGYLGKVGLTAYIRREFPFRLCVGRLK